MPRIELLDSRRHDRDAFACGEPTLDDYVKRLAAQHHRDGIATTHLLVGEDAPSRILGYYTLSAAQLLLAELRDVDRKRLPRYPVSAVRLGRLAVASTEQGKRHGEALLAHAIQRSLDLRAELGVKVIVVDTLHEHAAAFYRAYGFRETASDARTLYLPLGRLPAKQ